MSHILFIILLLMLCWGAPENGFAQTSDAPQKTQKLLASLSKTKYKKKEKKNFLVEVYVDIKSEAALKNNVREYAGIYESEDSSFRIELRVDSDERVEGGGYETYFQTGNRENFTLRNAGIEGALLTAEKVYSTGRTEKLEAVFINRTAVAGKNRTK